MARGKHVAIDADAGILQMSNGHADEQARLAQQAGERMLQLAMVDPVVNAAFFDVMMMVAKPETLSAPHIAASRRRPAPRCRAERSAARADRAAVA